MKRFTLILSLLLMAAMPVFAAHVTPGTAQKAASTFLNSQGAKATQLVDLSQKAGFPNLYIFTTEESFVVISADDCAQPILGYSTTNGFMWENMPENFNAWLKDYDSQIQYAIEQKLVASPEVTKQWNDLVAGNTNGTKATMVVAPLIQTKWNQGDPYNMFCPGGSVTGCVATAMAQIIKFWDYPVHGMGTHTYTPADHPEYGPLTCNYNDTYFDWANMTNTYSSSSTTAQKEAVATLMYLCGVSVNMNYHPESSGAPSTNVPGALKYLFGFSENLTYYEKDSYTDSWENLLKNELNAGRPIYYSGNNESSGHAFVCDGYNSSNYFHFNWGWGGSHDDYWAIGALNPGSGGIGSGAGTYNLYNAVVVGIQPPTPTCTAAEPTNLDYTLVDKDLTLTWDAASGAVSYNIYRENGGNLIGNTTGTSLVLNNIPYGTSMYFVRSVDSNGAQSYASNSVTVTLDYTLPAVTDLTATLSGDKANLSWTAPAWCYPETESVRLHYGEYTGGTYYYFGWPEGQQDVWWGHRYLPSDLTETNGMVIYKVSFFARQPGSYELHLFQGTGTTHYSSGDYDYPQTEIANKSFNLSASELGWFDIDLDAPVTIDPTQDFWVFLYDPEKKEYPPTSVPFTDHNRGGYWSTSTNINTWTQLDEGMSFLIYTYLTDGTYTYNLYNDGVKIAENLTETSYSNVTLNNNATNQLVVKTQRDSDEFPSNMVGYAKGNASVASLEMGDNDMMTVTENATLTVSGTASNDDAAHLILENGAQFVHNSTGVKATMKKNIEAYTGDDNGWYFIASPVTENITPSTENGLLNGDYDLFYYDEPTHYWMNQEEATFNLVHKQGYLYANNTATTLQFAGTLTPSNSPVNITGLSHSATALNGFNLVGNPFVCNATINQDCYVIDGGTIMLATGTKTFAPGEGAFVKATSDAYTVTFTKSTGGKASSTDYFDIVINQDKSTLDRARVRFNEGSGMEKISFDNNPVRLALTQNGNDYAVLYAANQNEIPVSFKAAEGTYTLNMETAALELDYLHLIDNLTGADIDLLVNPSYTFEANGSDYTSRFKLVFMEKEDNDNNYDNFAFVSNSNIIVNGQGTLQVFDVNGRELFTKELSALSSQLSALSFSSGVYVLRLVSDNNVKTQKIVIK